MKKYHKTILKSVNSILFKVFNKKIDLMIVGAQKCGTTALHNFLDTHPKIEGSSPKEINFFTFDKLYNKGENFYHRFFKFHFGEKIYFDASPSYLQDFGFKAAKRMYKYNPAVKIIILIRNPIDRAYSAFKMYERYWNKNKDWFIGWREVGYEFESRNENDFKSFDNYIQHELKYIKESRKIDAPVLSHGFYIDGINELLKFFSKEQIMIIENDDLKDNLHIRLNEILSFLNIGKSYKWRFSENERIFSGNYNKKISEEIQKLLSDFYKQKNEELFDFLNKEYDWR